MKPGACKICGVAEWGHSCSGAAPLSNLSDFDVARGVTTPGGPPSLKIKGCPGCASRDKEIRDLKAQIEALRITPDRNTVTPATVTRNAERQKRYRERKKAHG